MACLIRDQCDGTTDDVFCSACTEAVTGALREAPPLLRLLAAETPRSLAHPVSAAPARRSRTTGVAPAHDHVIDVSARLVEAIAEWAAVTGRPPARTLPGIASACARLAAAPYRYLAVLGGVASAQATLRATRAARRAVALAVEPRRLPDRCPTCGTRALTQLTNHGPVECEYCDHTMTSREYTGLVAEEVVLPTRADA